jgi:hypothetical protein
MLHLSDVMKLYSEQISGKDAIIITEEHGNILFMNDIGHNLTDFSLNDDISNNSEKFVIYDLFDKDKILVNKNIIIQGIRPIKIFGNKSFWIFLNLIPTDVGNIYLLQCNKIDDTYHNINVSSNELSPIDIEVTLHKSYGNILSDIELLVLKYLILDFSHNLIIKKINISRTTLNRIFQKISFKIFGEVFYAKQIVQKINFYNNSVLLLN